MEQSPSSETDSHSATQKISRLLRTLKVHYRVHKIRYWSITWARCIQFTPSHYISPRPIPVLKLKTNQTLGKWTYKAVVTAHAIVQCKSHSQSQQNQCHREIQTNDNRLLMKHGISYANDNTRPW